MHPKYLLPALLLSSLSACTTVNFSQMTSPTEVAPTTSGDVNLVLKTTERLYEVFTEKGWSQDNSEKMAVAANILVKGISVASKEETASHSYAQSVENVMQLEQDIQQATHHVSQAAKAAEVLGDISPANAHLRPELIGLERALLSATAAEAVFKMAAFNLTGEQESDTLTVYSQSVKRLRHVTDKYGDRVREGTLLSSKTS